MQHLGRDVAGIEPAAQPEQLAQALVLGPKRGEKLRQVGGGIALEGDLPEPHPAGAPLLGPGLEPDQGEEHRLAQRVGHPAAPGNGREEPKQREAETEQKERCVPACVTAI